MKKNMKFFLSIFFLSFAIYISVQAVSIKKTNESLILSKDIKLINSDVFSVNQKVTKISKSWTYIIKEAGNYQVGYAWVWVEGNNKTVDVEIKIGTETIKRFTAKSAVAPYRFETRIENLSEGKKIRVIATPKDGASYKLNYRLAYATPSFKGLPIFNVDSYGAIGNGSDNDYQAIKNACNAAVSAGGGIVKFDGTKDYYVRGPKGYLLFDFKQKSNIKIEGNGANITLHPDGTFIYLDEAENIHIDGFTTTYAPLPYFQGKILNINVDEVYLDVQVEERYVAPLVGKYVSRQERFGRSFWNTIANTAMGDGKHLSVDSTARIDNNTHKIRVFFKKKEAKDLKKTKDKNATVFIAPHRDYAHVVDYRESYYSNIHRSSRIKISNILTNSVCHFAYKVGSNTGPISFTNTDILVPNPKDMHVTWRDGWHVWGNRYGIMIEDGDFDAGFMYDDVFSPHMNVPSVIKINDKTILLKKKPGGESYEKYTDKRLWQIGDLVSFWNKNQTVFQGIGRIIDVVDDKSTSKVHITLNNVSKEIEVGSFAINEELINRDMVVRNCTTNPSGRPTAVRQRTPILYENCNFKNIHFWIYNGEPFRTRPRNIVFKNSNIFERKTFNIDDAWNVTVQNSTIHGQVDVDSSPSVILDNVDAKEIKLKNNTLVYFFGKNNLNQSFIKDDTCLLYTSPSPRD